MELEHAPRRLARPDAEVEDPLRAKPCGCGGDPLLEILVAGDLGRDQRVVLGREPVVGDAPTIATTTLAT